MKGGKKSLGRGWQLRLIVAVILGGWMAFAPAYRQVFDGDSDWFPRWVMFHGFGRAVCDARFFQFVEEEDGTTRRHSLDRFEVLGKPRDWATNKSLVRISSKAEVEAVGARMCRALGPGVDVRALARCGSRGHWKAKLNFETKLCKSTSSKRRFRPKVYR